MTDELTALSAAAASALVSAASSAGLWAEVEPWISAEQQDEPRSAGLIQFQDELAWTVKALEDATGCLNHRAKSHIVQRWENRLLQLLRATPEMAKDLRGIITVVQQGVDKSPLTRHVDDFILAKRWSSSGILQIGVGSVAGRTASSRYNEEKSSPAGRSVAPPNVLSANMCMEFAGDRTEAPHGQTMPGLRPLIWQPSALASLVEPPFELLPSKLYGRLELLRNLERLLLQPDRKLHILAGEPGVGKSVLALTLAERARKRGMRVWWVHGAAESIDLCMIAVAKQLGADPAELTAARAGRRNLADLVWSHLERVDVPWMLVFDEVDACGDSQRGQSPPLDEGDWVRPSNAGLVLVTSRHVDAGPNGRHRMVHRVDPLEPDDAARFLQSGVADGGSNAKAMQLAQYLTSSPLTVELTVKYLSSGISPTRLLSQYLDELRNTARKHQAGSTTQNRNQLDSIIRLIFSRLDHDGMAEVSALLILISHFAPGIPVPCSMLDVGPLVEYGVLPAVPRRENSKRIHRAIRILSSLGLASVRPHANSYADFGTASIRVHPLIAATCLNVLENGSAAVADAARLGAAMVLQRAIRHQLGSANFDWGDWFLLTSHVKALMLRLPRHSPVAAIEEAVTAAQQTVERLARTGAYKSAEKLGRGALSLASGLPAENAAVLQMSVCLARILIVRGSIGEAQELLQRVLEVRQRSRGLEYSATLDTLELIAFLLHSQGELGQAKQMLSQVIQGRDRRPGGEVSDGMQALSSLARILREQGRLAETERIARQVLATRQCRQGVDALDSLDAAVDYSVALRDLGRLHEAEAMQRNVLEARERVLGKEHPDTMGAKGRLAETLRDLGRLHEAEAMQGNVLEAREQVLGRDHPETLNSRLGLTVILRDTGRLEEAEELLRRLINFHEPIAGLGSPILLSARHNLATVLYDKGCLDESELIFRKVLDERQWLLGPNHLETLRTLSNLGSLLHIKGSLTEAEHMLREAEAAYSDMLGENHPRTLTVRNNLANVLFDSNSSTDVGEIYKSVLATQLEALGPAHPETLTTCQNLAAALSSAGSQEAARQVLSDVIAEYECIFKPDHPSLLHARYILAGVQERQGYLDKALHSYIDVLHLQMAALGTVHPDTIATRLSASNVLWELRHSSESRAEYEQAVMLAARASSLRV